MSNNWFINVDRCGVFRRAQTKGTGVYFHVIECPNEAEAIELQKEIATCAKGKRQKLCMDAKAGKKCDVKEQRKKVLNRLKMGSVDPK